MIGAISQRTFYPSFAFPAKSAEEDAKEPQIKTQYAAAASEVTAQQFPQLSPQPAADEFNAGMNDDNTEGESEVREESLSAMSKPARKAGETNADASSGPQELSEEEQSRVEELRTRDREVHVHEQAHKAAGGRYAGAMSFSYEVGPDGKRYAVGGEVSIDVSEGNTPEQTISKSQSVRAAALAPAEPSSQDRRVAAMAAQMAASARKELNAEEVSAEDERGQAADDKDASRIGTDAAPSSVPDTDGDFDNDTTTGNPEASRDRSAATAGTAGAAATDKIQAGKQPAAKTDSEGKDVPNLPRIMPSENVVTIDNAAKNADTAVKPNVSFVIKAYQDNTPPSISPAEAAIAGSAVLSMAM